MNDSVQMGKTLSSHPVGGVETTNLDFSFSTKKNGEIILHQYVNLLPRQKAVHC